MKNYAQHSDEVQNPIKYLTEDAVRKFDGWDFEEEDSIAEQFVSLRKSPVFKFCVTAVVTAMAFAALYVLMCQ